MGENAGVLADKNDQNAKFLLVIFCINYMKNSDQQMSLLAGTERKSENRELS